MALLHFDKYRPPSIRVYSALSINEISDSVHSNKIMLNCLNLIGLLQFYDENFVNMLHCRHFSPV